MTLRRPEIKATRSALSRVPAIAFAVTVTLASYTALATTPCSCPSLGYSPPPDAEGVPTNVRILGLVADGDVASINLLKNPASESTEAVAFHVEEASSRHRWVIPDAELDPNTAYSVVTSGLGVPFRTGPGPDSAAPTFASINVQGAPLSGACEDHLGALVAASALSDDVTPPHNLVMEVEVASPPRRFLLPASSPAFGRITADEPEFSQCLDQYPDAEDGVVYTASVKVLDWAGNASAPRSNEFVFSEGGLPGCQCTITRAPQPRGFGLAAGLFAAGLLACVARRRRAREWVRSGQIGWFR
jgi:hypothetical protein